MPTSATIQPCLHCQQTFQPKRRNQYYCSAQCRVDANNDKAKQAYSTYQQEAPQLAPLQAELAQLKIFLQQQLLVLRGIEEVDRQTIRWQDHFYYRHEMATHELRACHISIHSGGGIYIVERDEILYRRQGDLLNMEAYRYKRKAS